MSPVFLAVALTGTDLAEEPPRCSTVHGLYPVMLPLGVDGARKSQFRAIELHASTDAGLTWTRMSSVDPNAKCIPFEPSELGIYAVKLIVVKWDGATEPPDIRGTFVDKHIRVMPAVP